MEVPEQLTDLTFDFRVVPDRDHALVFLAGEIDIATASEIRWRLAGLPELGFASVTLDLRGVTFIDLSGLRAIERARARALARGIRFDVVAEPPAVSRLLRLAGEAMRGGVG
jgi:anti-sigma B factor antagonist